MNHRKEPKYYKKKYSHYEHPIYPESEISLASSWNYADDSKHVQFDNEYDYSSQNDFYRGRHKKLFSYPYLHDTYNVYEAEKEFNDYDSESSQYTLYHQYPPQKRYTGTDSVYTREELDYKYGSYDYIPKYKQSYNIEKDKIPKKLKNNRISSFERNQQPVFLSQQPMSYKTIMYKDETGHNMSSSSEPDLHGESATETDDDILEPTNKHGEKLDYKIYTANPTGNDTSQPFSKQFVGKPQENIISVTDYDTIPLISFKNQNVILSPKESDNSDNRMVYLPVIVMQNEANIMGSNHANSELLHVKNVNKPEKPMENIEVYAVQEEEKNIFKNAPANMFDDSQNIRKGSTESNQSPRKKSGIRKVSKTPKGEFAALHPILKVSKPKKSKFSLDGTLLTIKNSKLNKKSTMHNQSKQRFNTVPLKSNLNVVPSKSNLNVVSSKSNLNVVSSKSIPQKTPSQRSSVMLNSVNCCSTSSRHFKNISHDRYELSLAKKNKKLSGQEINSTAVIDEVEGNESTEKPKLQSMVQESKSKPSSITPNKITSTITKQDEINDRKPKGPTSNPNINFKNIRESKVMKNSPDKESMDVLPKNKDMQQSSRVSQVDNNRQSHRQTTDQVIKEESRIPNIERFNKDKGNTGAKDSVSPLKPYEKRTDEAFLNNAQVEQTGARARSTANGDLQPKEVRAGRSYISSGEVNTNTQGNFKNEIGTTQGTPTTTKEANTTVVSQPFNQKNLIGGSAYIPVQQGEITDNVSLLRGKISNIKAKNAMSKRSNIINSQVSKITPKLNGKTKEKKNVNQSKVIKSDGIHNYYSMPFCGYNLATILKIIFGISQFILGASTYDKFIELLGNFK